MRHKNNKMSAKHIIALFLVQFVLFTYGQGIANFFRKDYDYIESTRAFYKFHTLHRTWEAAKERCEFEGATLFYPNDEDEAMAVIDYWKKKQSLSMVFIGVSTPNVKVVFETIDGLPITQVYEKWGRGEPNDYNGKEGCVVMRVEGTLHDDLCEKPFPFFCKKTLNSLQWNAACHLPDQSYIYSPQGRCYKFHLEPRNWEDAVTICNAEQSYLAVINSDAEAELLVNITRDAPKDQVEDTDYMSGAVHLGFKLNGRWKTIKTKSLVKSGYAKWETGKPDEKAEKKCGSMLYNGKLNDIECNQKCFFICEHEPVILTAQYDFRFGEVNQLPNEEESSNNGWDTLRRS